MWEQVNNSILLSLTKHNSLKSVYWQKALLNRGVLSRNQGASLCTFSPLLKIKLCISVLTILQIWWNHLISIGLQLEWNMIWFDSLMLLANNLHSYIKSPWHWDSLHQCLTVSPLLSYSINKNLNVWWLLWKRNH